VFFTGQSAEQAVKNIPGVTQSFIGRHEELADLSVVLIEALGALALFGLVLLKRSGAIPRFVMIAVLVLSLLTAAVVGLTANFGGQIRHTEIRR
jgi:uncharacterized membrane protein